MEKAFYTIIYLLFLGFFAVTGCQSNGLLPNGFYVQDVPGRSSNRLEIADPDGKTHEFFVREYTNLVVNEVRTYSLKSYEAAFQVEINAVSTDAGWSEKFPILIIQGKPYLELFKTSTLPDESNGTTLIPVTIKLKVSTECEADVIKAALSKNSGSRIKYR